MLPDTTPMIAVGVMTAGGLISTGVGITTAEELVAEDAILAIDDELCGNISVRRDIGTPSP